MNNTLKIREDKLMLCAIKEAGPRLAVVAIPMVLGGVMSAYLGEYGSMVALICIFGLAVGLALLLKAQYVRTYRFEFTEEFVSLLFDTRQSNALLKLLIGIAESRNRRRFGGAAERKIALAAINTIAITGRGITITAKDNSLLTNNGKLLIPAELEEYEQVKLMFEKLKG